MTSFPLVAGTAPRRPIYCRIQDIRDEGVGTALADPTLYPDARIITLLERTADLIERLTQQHFGPIRKNFYRDGRNGRQIEEPDANKILEIEVVNLVLPDHTTFSLSPQVYVVYDREVKLRRGETGLPSERAVKEGGEAWTLNNYSKTRREITLPDELHNVQVMGTFGWLDRTVPKSTVDPAAGGKIVLSSKETTLLQAQLNQGDKIIAVGSTGSFQIDDVLHIDPRQSNFWVIVGGVWALYTTTAAPLANGGTSVALTSLGGLLPIFTSLDVSMNTLTLPRSTITVASTAGYAPQGGQILVTTSAGIQSVSYTSIVGNNFEGCSGGVGTMSTGGLVQSWANVNVGDVVTINDGTTSVNVTVTAINTNTNTISFAAVTLTATIVSGATAAIPAPPEIVTQWNTSTAGVLQPGGTFVQLADVSQAAIGDVVTIDDGNTQTSVVVTQVDPGSKTIFFAPCVMIVYNALSPGSIAAGANATATRNSINPGYVTIDPSPKDAVIGASVIRWGRVPREIKEATMRAFFVLKGGLFQDPSQSPINFYLNKSEKTDNYQYDRFPLFKNPSNLFSGTGDPVADSILSRYRAAPYAQYA